ncbi:hypothetical protein [Halegenticoccus soli]|uniref:hypothetical protein n=1 Tax=Halegenticoccus soli TaxID=1985678 RepID=UPI0018EA7D25|nr:hypothetical protein [Halegenticoccus soli]
MLNDLACACEAPECGRPLSEESLMLVMRNAAGERRAYECDCGAVTITVVRE